VPTRKQRRRREKERRHEWEEVYVDETGREIEPDEVDEVRREPRGRENGRRAASRRSRRTVDPPSWRRVGKRALVFAPFMFIVITLLDPKTSLAAHVLYTLQLMVLFIPFSFLVDTVSYRVQRKRLEQAEPTRSARG
jgi:hypothetical protein